MQNVHVCGGVCVYVCVCKHLWAVCLAIHCPTFFGMLIFIWQEVSRNSFPGAGYLDF